MRRRALGIDLQGAAELRFGAGPVPVAVQTGKAQDGMRGRQALVEGQRAVRRFPGAEVVVEQGARFGKTREGGRERGIGGGGLLEILDRRAQVTDGAAGEVLLAPREGFRRWSGRRRLGSRRGRRGDRRRDLEPGDQQCASDVDGDFRI